MGVGGKKPAMHEIEDTRGSVKDDAFEELIEKIKASGAEIIKDETTPHFFDLGDQEFETGTQRVFEFNINKTDFQLTRKVEYYRVTGEGRHKSVEELSSPRSHVVMRKKPETSDDWQIVDVEDIF